MRTAPVPNMAAIPGMNPGIFILGGGGDGGGSGGGDGDGSGDKYGGKGKNGGKDAKGGGKNANSCGPGSGGGCPNPKHGNGGTAAGDPIDPLTGRAYTIADIDLALPGPIPLFLQRTYSTSAAERDVGLGFGWMCSLGWEIIERRRTIRVIDPLGGETVAPKPELGAMAHLPCGLLRRDEGGFYLDCHDKVVRIFKREDAVGERFRLTRIADAYGNNICLTYGEKGLEHVYDSAGRVVRVRRDRTGHIAAFEVQNAVSQGRWVAFRTYEYDDAGHLTAAVDAAGYATHYTYDEANRLLTLKRPSGLVVETRYDTAGRAVESWCHREQGTDGLDSDVPAMLADGKTPAKGFLHCKVEYHAGFSEVFTSRSARRVEGDAVGDVGQMSWGQGTFSRTFDEGGALTSYADAAGATWVFHRDPLGQLLREVDPLGQVIEHDFDSFGTLARSRYPTGEEVRYTRDAGGQLLAIDDGLGRVAGFAYDDRGLITLGTMADGAATHMAHDVFGNRVEVCEPDGTRRKLRYDHLGRVVAFMDERGQPHGLSYDERGNLREMRWPSGATSTYEYDADSALVRFTRADGRRGELVRGGYGQIVAVVRPGGGTIHYRYDREQDLVRIVNEAGDEHRIVRDGEGRILEERTFDGRTLRYTHDLNGRVIRMDHGDNDFVDIVYDAVGNIVSKTHVDGWTEKFEYDAAGRMVSASNDLVTCRFERDRRGNIVREITEHGADVRRVESSYSPNLKRTGTRVDGAFTTELRLDSMGRPLEVKAGDTWLMGFAYEPGGLTRSATLGAGGTIEWGHDADGMLTSLAVRGPRPPASARPGEPAFLGRQGGESLWQEMGWSPAHDLLWQRDSARGKLEIEHDAYGRVVHLSLEKKTREKFRHGAAGELYDTTSPDTVMQYGPGGRLLEKDGATYRYDHRGRRVEKRVVGRNGHSGVWTYTWGGNGLLARIDGPDGRVRFVHDPFARLVEKTVETPKGEIRKTRYVWDDRALARTVEERWAPGDGGAERHVEERDYVVLPRAFSPIAQRVRRDGEQGSWEHLVFDTLNNVPAALVRPDGTVAHRLDPSYLGRIAAAQEALTHVRYPGQMADLDTGLHDNMHRAYDPETGSFLSPEPLGIGASLMPYAYADHEPHRVFDPDGLAVPSTVSGSAGTFTQNAGANMVNRPLHPAVAASLPNANARQRYPEPPEDHPTTQCGDPHAFSDYLFAWENQNGRRCDPATPEGRAALGDALKSVNSFKSERTRNGKAPEPFAPCPNCSQTISRLYGLAGMSPPHTAGSAETPASGTNPATMRDGRRIDKSTGTYESPYRDPSGNNANDSRLQQQLDAGNGAAMARANQPAYQQAVNQANANPDAQQWNNSANPANPNATVPDAGVYQHDQRVNPPANQGDNHQGTWERTN